jgi:hypothetical protein
VFRPRPTPIPRNGLDDLYARLHILDLVVPVPDDGGHHHLACLGTRPGYDARMVTDQLLHRQCQLNDRDGHTFYAEVHEERFEAWLRLRSPGYHNHGVSLSTDSNPESHLVSYVGARP